MPGSFIEVTIGQFTLRPPYMMLYLEATSMGLLINLIIIIDTQVIFNVALHCVWWPLSSMERWSAQ